MTFDPNAEAIANSAMQAVNPLHTQQYVTVIRFLALNPGAAAVLPGASAPKVGSSEYIRRQATAFSKGREPRAPRAPSTVPDDMVSVILEEYFGIPITDLERMKQEHLLSMGAENLVGDLLERYLAKTLEPKDWVWCSGSIVKSVDFIKSPEAVGQKWRLLQVKNRDNSENSSSSAIRIGSEIEKWHRSFSRRVGSNWSAFPDAELGRHLSEEDFKAFAREYLRSLK
jgi:hypothetical protein